MCIRDRQKTELDKKTAYRGTLLLNDYIMEEAMGRLNPHSWLMQPDVRFPREERANRIGGHHHMGGTRMAASAALGVVDENCQLFGSDNLYAAGSSIFATGSQVTPTLTIVQFALRLADHLPRVL